MIKGKEKLFFLYALLSIGLFIATLVFGTTLNGAKNWIYIKNQGFQPSEFIRILFVLALAALLEKRSGGKIMQTEMRKSLAIMVYAYINIGFLVIQREWGIAVLFFLIYISLFFVFGS